ncbi:MAG TPA: quinoprotein dehydrogenase-associated putative ABC transporter substrate-binding protein [Steroidobacteraceae bacterium]|nr:quinoprotein dehydrogenase-associated putative ABC transporter substrate-binding protein [Steroidobacteraceae bacterium]
MRLALLALVMILPVAAHGLTVCADPNNMPFSNHREQGFENHLAQLIARQLHTTVRYEWWAQRRGFARQTLAQSRCDIWPGVAAGLQGMATTEPYYRSTYVFASRQAADLSGLSLDDPRLRTQLVGVELIGDDGANTPPASALATRGITGNVRGFTVYGDYRQPNPPTAILDALAHNAIQVALVWGPLAGFYAEHSAVPLRLQPITDGGGAGEPMAFSISVGVRRGDPELLAKINEVLHEQAPAIRSLLRRYGVPLLGTP